MRPSLQSVIRVCRAGLLSSIQDTGRIGLRRLGIPWAGTVAPSWMQAANTLVDNAVTTAIIECFEGGLMLQACHQPVRMAVVGDATLVIEGPSGKRDALAWQSLTLATEEILRVQDTGRWTLAIVAIRGLAIPAQLGSSSTYTRAGLGGLHGRALQAGDELPVNSASSDATGQPGTSGLPAMPRNSSGEQALAPFGEPHQDAEGILHLRAVPGPQHDHFTVASMTAFFSQVWCISPEADRMGVRLQGDALEHRDASARDIVSDAILPGSVQVPGAGQPIVMLADAHTAGGYPKIATVISCDLSMLALARPGAGLRFNSIEADAAGQIARQAVQQLARCLKRLRPTASIARLDPEVLTHTNLISGVTDGSEH